MKRFKKCMALLAALCMALTCALTGVLPPPVVTDVSAADPVTIQHAWIMSETTIRLEFSHKMDNKSGVWISVRVVDDMTSQILQYDSGTPLQWGFAPDTHSWVPDGYPMQYWDQYCSRGTPVTVKGKSVVTLSEIMALVEPGGDYEGCHVTFSMEELASGEGYVANDGYIDTYYEYGNSDNKLVATKQADLDGIYVELEPFPTDRYVQMQRAYIYDDRTLVVRFSEPFKNDGNYWSSIRLVDANNTLQYVGSSPQQWAVPISAYRGADALIGTLSTSWSTISGNANPNGYKFLRYSMEEKSHDGTHVVEGFESTVTPGKYLFAQKAQAGYYDGAYCEITPVTVRKNITAAKAVSDKEITVTFDSSVTDIYEIICDPQMTLRFTDGDGKVTTYSGTWSAGGAANTLTFTADRAHFGYLKGSMEAGHENEDGSLVIGAGAGTNVTFDAGVDPLYAPIVTSVEVLSDMQMLLTFSESVDFVGSPFMALRLNDSEGRLLYDGSSPLQWSCIPEFTDDTHTQMILSVNGWHLGTKSLYDVLNMTGELEAWRGRGSIAFCIEEVPREDVDHSTENGYIDNILSRSDGTAVPATFMRSGYREAVQMEVTGDAPTETVELLSAEAISGSEIVATFSAPVNIDVTPFIALRFVDANNNVLYNGEATPANAIQWTGTWEWYNDEHTQIKWTVSPDKASVKTILSKQAVPEDKRDLGSVVFCIEEMPPCTQSSWHIENITLASDSRIHLLATHLSGRDGACLPVTENYDESGFPHVKRVEVVNDQQLMVTFSESIDMPAAPWISLRLVDADGILQYIDGSPQQWALAGDFTDSLHTKMLLTVSGAWKAGTTSLYDVLHMTGELAAWKDKGCSVLLSIEETPVAGLVDNTKNGLVDNMRSRLTGKGLLATFINYSYREAVHMPLTGEAPEGTVELVSAEAISGSEIVATFSAPVKFDVEPFMALRLVDDYNNVLYNGDPLPNGANAYQWSGTWEWYNKEHTQIKWTVSPTKSSVKAILSKAGIPEDKQYGNIVFCIEEMLPCVGSSMHVDNITLASDSRVHLFANHLFGRDGACVSVTESYKDDAGYPYVKKVEVVNDQQMLVTFSESVEMPAAPFMALRLVDKDGVLQWSGEENASSPRQWTCLNNGFTDDKHTQMLVTVSGWPLGTKTLYDILHMTGELEAYKDKGCSITFTMEDMPVEGVVTMAANGLVDNIYSRATGKHLLGTFMHIRYRDAVHADVVGEPPKDTLEVLSAVPNSDNSLIVTFSAPVSIDVSPFMALRLVDENNTMVWIGEMRPDTANACQWPGTWEWYNDEHTQIKWTMSGSSPMNTDGKRLDLHNMNTVLDMDNFPEELRGYTLKFCIEEMLPCSGNSMHVDNVTLTSDSRIHLMASMPSGRDGVYVPISERTYTPVSVWAWSEIINEQQVLIDFREPVQITGKPFMALRYVDPATGQLMYSGGERYSHTPLQFSGTWDWADESHSKIIWTMNGGNYYGGNNIYDIYYQASEGLSMWEGQPQVVMAIEEYSSDGFTAHPFDDLVANITSIDGSRHLHCSGGDSEDSMADGNYSVPNTDNLPEAPLTVVSATAVDDMTVDVVFSEPVKFAEGDLAPTVGIRYLLNDEPQIANDGRTLRFNGDITWIDEQTMRWTFDADNRFGAKNLSDVFLFAGELGTCKGSTVAFCIEDPTDENLTFQYTKLVQSVSSTDGRTWLNGTAYRQFAVSRNEIELGYELPELSTETIAPTPAEIAYSYLWVYCTSAAVAAAGIAAGIIAGFAVKKKSQKNAG